MPKQIDIQDDLHADVKSEVAQRNKVSRFTMADASAEAFKPWLVSSRHLRETENQKTGAGATVGNGYQGKH
jgi:hypothetical protein